jgi:hypothetical protein
MRFLPVLAPVLLIVLQACNDSTPVRPAEAYFLEESADIVRAVYASDKTGLLDHYPEEDRDQIWTDTGSYVERYQPFGPIKIEGTEVLATDEGINVAVRYATAAEAHCQTFVFFRPGRDSYYPALHPLSPTVDGCIGAWGGSER